MVDIEERMPADEYLGWMVYAKGPKEKPKSGREAVEALTALGVQRKG